MAGLGLTLPSHPDIRGLITHACIQAGPGGQNSLSFLFFSSINSSGARIAV
jgi:hypothetical protein